MSKKYSVTEFKSLNHQRFVEMGRDLFGDFWMTPAAKALSIDHKQVRRYAHGEYEPSDEIIAQLATLARKRAMDLMKKANRG